VSEKESHAEAVGALEWSDSLSVCVMQIDEQHKKLVEAVNELNSKLQAGSSQEEQKKAIEEIVYLASDNMRLEEEMMQEFHFPGFKAHLLLHAEVAAVLLKLRWQFEQAGFVLTNEIIAVLMSCLRSHIRDVDRRYAACFNGNGVR
jgi:hemerythrin-like metal-binding protein